MNKKFLVLTLANGGEPVIIRPEHIAFAMTVQGVNKDGVKESFTRIFPNDIVIDAESNWLDVTETPSEIARKCR